MSQALRQGEHLHWVRAAQQLSQLLKLVATVPQPMRASDTVVPQTRRANSHKVPMLACVPEQHKPCEPVEQVPGMSQTTIHIGARSHS